DERGAGEQVVFRQHDSMAPWKRRRTGERPTCGHIQRRLFTKNTPVVGPRERGVDAGYGPGPRSPQCGKSAAAKSAVIGGGTAIGPGAGDEVPQMKMAGDDPGHCLCHGIISLHRGQSSGSTLTMAAP